MIETRDLTKTFDNFTAVDSLNLKIEKGEFCVIVGASGAGKRGIFWPSRTERSRQDNDHQPAVNPSSSHKGRNPYRRSAAYKKTS